jgi:hypothetical protein
VGCPLITRTKKTRDSETVVILKREVRTQKGLNRVTSNTCQSNLIASNTSESDLRYW